MNKQCDGLLNLTTRVTQFKKSKKKLLLKNIHLYCRMDNSFLSLLDEFVNTIRTVVLNFTKDILSQG